MILVDHQKGFLLDNDLLQEIYYKTNSFMGINSVWGYGRHLILRSQSV